MPSPLLPADPAPPVGSTPISTCGATGRRVLVARLDNLGDVLLTGPAVRAAAAGAARVVLLCGPGGQAAAELLPRVDEVLVWEAPWVPLEAPPVDRAGVAELVERVGAAAIDDALVLTSFHQSPLPLALLLRLAGVDRLAAVSVDHPGSLLDARLAYDETSHEVTQGLAVAAALGYHLPAGDDDRLRLRPLPPAPPPVDRPYVVVHPGASVAARGLPPALLDGLVDELVGRGWAVVRTGTAGEGAAWPLVPRDGLVDRAGRTTLAALAAVVAGAAAVVCGNTGTAHLAAAVGTPVAWVFAPVVARSRWHPWRVPHRVLGDQTIACAGCRSRVCPRRPRHPEARPPALTPPPDGDPSGGSRPTRLTVVGDALLDVDIRGEVERICPDSPVPVLDEHDELLRPGGAALTATLAARAGARVTLVTALGRDVAGRRLARLLDDEGVAVCDLGLEGPTPEKVRLVAAGQRLLRLDRGGAPSAIRGRSLGPAVDAIASAGAVVVSDYGRGLAGHDVVRRALAARATRPRPSLVWDPHPRGPVPVAESVVTPNGEEARAVALRWRGPADDDGDGLAADAARARALLERWQARGVAVTRGRQGAVLAVGAGPPLVVPGRQVDAADSCGAGDAFAVHTALALAAGRTLPEAVEQAVAAAGAFVAAGAAGALLSGAPELSGGSELSGASAPGVGAGGRPGPAAGEGADTADPFELARAVRAAGGTVVATGGCFDLLHAGHVDLLRQARQLGDVLVVCLNADRSVRRLKGDGRPLQSEHDRRAVLLALDAVDGVVVFEEDTPVEALRRLRPHVFVKGGDYTGVEIPEAALCAGWGGAAVTVPYLSGRSTSGLVELVRRGR